MEMSVNHNLAILALCCVSAHCSAWFMDYLSSRRDDMRTQNEYFEFEWANRAEADVETLDFLRLSSGFASVA